MGESPVKMMKNMPSALTMEPTVTLAVVNVASVRYRTMATASFSTLSLRHARMVAFRHTPRGQARVLRRYRGDVAYPKTRQ
jgi:hypothetical protein